MTPPIGLDKKLIILIASQPDSTQNPTSRTGTRHPTFPDRTVKARQKFFPDRARQETKPDRGLEAPPDKNGIPTGPTAVRTRQTKIAERPCEAYYIGPVSKSREPCWTHPKRSSPLALELASPIWVGVRIGCPSPLVLGAPSTSRGCSNWRFGAPGALEIAAPGCSASLHGFRVCRQRSSNSMPR